MTVKAHKIHLYGGSFVCNDIVSSPACIQEKKYTDSKVTSFLSNIKVLR